MKRVITHLKQILAITTDNTTNNDKMIEELAKLLESFSGAANQVRCFAHVLNLMARSIIWLFDVPKGSENEDALSDAERAYRQAAEGVDLEEDEMQMEMDDDEVGPDDEMDRVDKMVGMSKEELEELAESLHPICMVLSKVSCGFFF